MQNKPLIVGFVADLMFTSKIENAARRIGYRIQWVENAALFGKASPEEKPGEALHGRSGQLFQAITNWQPALLLFDLGNKAIPWQKWIPRLKSSPATRRIPILCFGSHMNVTMMAEAKRIGADAVVARSRFTSDLPHLLQKYARLPDQKAIQAACAQPLPALARQGIDLFNQGEYYRCHDELEEAWRQDETLGRDLFRGILQIGVALYQVQQGNYRGAVKMLLRARQWLDPLPEICRTIHVAALRQNAAAIYEEIIALGPENITQFDWKCVEVVQYNYGN